MPRYAAAAARAAAASARCYSEALRTLGLRAAGGNHKVFRKWVDEIWKIPTDHFDRYAASRGHEAPNARPLEDYLVEHSTISRHKLKLRLYREGLKEPTCEICG